MSDIMYKFDDVNKCIDDANLKINKIKNDISYKKSVLEELKEKKEKILLEIEKLEKELSDSPKQRKKLEENIQHYKKIKKSEKLFYPIDDVTLYLFERYTCENGKYYSYYRVVPEFFIRTIIGYEEVGRIKYDRTDGTCSLSGNMHCSYEEDIVIEKEPIYRYDKKMDSNYEYFSDKKEILESYLGEYDKRLISKHGCSTESCFLKFELEELINEMKEKGYDFGKITNYVDGETIKLVAIYICSEYNLDNGIRDKYPSMSNNETKEESNKTKMLK